MRALWERESHYSRFQIKTTFYWVSGWKCARDLCLTIASDRQILYFHKIKKCHMKVHILAKSSSPVFQCFKYIFGVCKRPKTGRKSGFRRSWDCFNCASSPFLHTQTCPAGYTNWTALGGMSVQLTAAADELSLYSCIGAVAWHSQFQRQHRLKKGVSWNATGWCWEEDWL